MEPHIRTTSAVPGPRSAPEPADASEPDLTTTSAFTPAPAPVFVDATGRRRRLIRRGALTLLAVACAYGLAVALSFLGGPVPPNALLPIPDPPSAAPSNPAAPGKAGTAAPSVSGTGANAGSGNVGVGASPGATPAPGHSGTSAPSASPSPAKRVPPGHGGKTASPGPSNGHGH